jgi:hypothetical protein
MKINPFIGHERPPKYMGPNTWEPKLIKGWAITLGHILSLYIYLRFCDHVFESSTHFN